MHEYFFLGVLIFLFFAVGLALLLGIAYYRRRSLPNWLVRSGPIVDTHRLKQPL
jgi:hypothetical protein